MKLLKYGKDGGAKSTVSGFWLVEIKSLFSIVILRFDKGSREMYHSHAFNAITWFLKGRVTEHHLMSEDLEWGASWKPKYTPRSCFHKVYAHEVTYALCIRGPWSKTWSDYDPKSKQLLEYSWGRKIKKVTLLELTSSE